MLSASHLPLRRLSAYKIKRYEPPFAVFLPIDSLCVCVLELGIICSLTLVRYDKL